MSNHLISEVYKRQVGSMARKAVLALFADKASDDGTGIWASKQRMAEEIGTTKQTVITTIKALIEDGLLSETGQRKSPNGYTVEYAIIVAALRKLPLVPSHRDDQSSGLTGQEALPVKQRYGTGKAPLPKPSKTPHNGLADAKPKRARKPKPAEPEIIIPDWLPAEPWAAFLDMRHRKGADPSPHAIGLLIGKLERWRAQGHDPGEVLNNSTENNWTGIFEPKAERNGQRNQNIRTGNGAGPDRRSSLARACDEALDFLG